MSAAFLLDTHALLWWAHDPSRLSERAYEAIGDGENVVFVSPVSAMEIATKSRRDRLGFMTPLANAFAAQLTARGFIELPVSSDHAQLAGGLDSPHNDPWDRLLAAQALTERLTLITKDTKIAGLGVATCW